MHRSWKPATRERSWVRISACPPLRSFFLEAFCVSSPREILCAIFHFSFSLISFQYFLSFFKSKFYLVCTYLCLLALLYACLYVPAHSKRSDLAHLFWSDLFLVVLFCLIISFSSSLSFVHCSFILAVSITISNLSLLSNWSFEISAFSSVAISPPFADDGWLGKYLVI